MNEFKIKLSIKDAPAEDMVMDCPVCKNDNAVVTQKILDIPHFSQVWLFHLNCKNCGFKHNDMLNLDVNEPQRHIYHAENKDDYTTKIVPSANGTIRFPQIGALIEPGPSADGFLNNIEGILHDIRDKAKFLLRDADSETEITKIFEYVKLLDEYITNSLPIDIIIEDPYGNSLILPFDERKLEIQKLSEEETQQLKTGYIVFSGENK